MDSCICIGPKQFLVKAGDIVYCHKLKGEEGEILTLEDSVLLHNKKVGTPVLKEFCSKWEIIKHGKKKKIDVIKFIPQKRHKRKLGFRQEYTKLKFLKVEKIK